MKDASSRSPASLFPVEEQPLPEYVSSVLESRSFQNAPALRSLLLFLWQHRDEHISEYGIATEALGRSALFSAKTDATVRVQISRLRQRLERFYEEEGRDHPWRLTIPIGSHQISLERLGSAEVFEPAAATLAPHENARRPYLIAALSLCCALLAIACSFLALKVYKHPAEAQSTETQAKPSRFWSAFYRNGLSTRIVLPTPVFFSYGPNGSPTGTIMVRDTNLNDYSKRADSRSLKTFDKLLGPAQLAQNYTVTSDTFAAIKLVRYLDGFHFPTTVHGSADAVLEALDTENVIALGTWGTMSPLATHLSKMNFQLASHEDSVENRSPFPGEPKRISQVSESEDRVIWPGVIAVLPGPNAHSHLLIIGGRQTSALVSFLTSTAGLSQLEQIWRRSGSPEFYELVVNAEVNGNNTTPVRFWTVALHRVPGPQ
jgi:hypothetical protein